MATKAKTATAAVATPPSHREQLDSAKQMLIAKARSGEALTLDEGEQLSRLGWSLERIEYEMHKAKRIWHQQSNAGTNEELAATEQELAEAEKELATKGDELRREIAAMQASLAIIQKRADGARTRLGVMRTAREWLRSDAVLSDWERDALRTAEALARKSVEAGDLGNMKSRLTSIEGLLKLNPDDQSHHGQAEQIARYADGQRLRGIYHIVGLTTVVNVGTWQAHCADLMAEAEELRPKIAKAEKKLAAALDAARQSMKRYLPTG